MSGSAQPMSGEGALKAAESALRKHGIEGNPVLGAFICSQASCRCVVRSEFKSFRDHLRKPQHGLKSNEYNALWKNAEEVAKSFPKNHRDRAAYWEGRTSAKRLPPIEGLSTEKVRACPHCGVLFKSWSTMYVHGSMKHPGKDCGRKIWPTLPWLQAQGLSKKRGNENLFVVQEIRRERDSDGEVGRRESNSLASVVAEYDPGSMEKSRNRHNSTNGYDREKSGFLRISKADERLASLGLTMEDAMQLTKFPDRYEEPRLNGMCKKLHSATVNLLVDANDEFNKSNVFRSVLLDIATSGTLEKKKPFRFLERSVAGDRTRERYARSARIILIMACRVYLSREKYFGIVMSEHLRNCVREMLACDMEDSEKLKANVHRVYTEVFLQQAVGVNGGAKLFSFAVVACLCVGGESSTEVRFRVGTEVSPIVVAMLYTASCCALLEIVKYGSSADTAEEGNSTVGEGLREEEVVERMKVGAKVGISVFGDMRGICSLLRDEETNAPSFYLCTKHEKCGIFNGIEYSIVALGRAVRQLQKYVREKIFDELLLGMELPTEYVERCRVLPDDECKNDEGYWFMSDVRNERFVKQCLVWLSTTVVPRIEEQSRSGWAKTADAVHKALLCLLHLTGGGPGRGSEIASMAVRNKRTSRRALYFGGENVMVVPTHNKTCSQRGGKMRVVYRFLDKETSFLLKTFFILVHPILVSLSESERTRKNTILPNKINESEEMQKLRDHLCLGISVESRITEVIGSCFARYGIPFKFKEYRHWQRGYVKSAGTMRVAADMMRVEGNMRGDEEEGQLDEQQIAAIEQGGHSVHTAFHAYAGLAHSGGRGEFAVERVKELQRKASEEWHCDLGLSVKSKAKKSETTIVSGKNREGCDAADLNEKTISVITEVVRKHIESSWDKRAGNEYFEGSKTCIRNLGGISEGKVESMEQKRSPEELVHPKNRAEENGYTAIVALRRVLNNKEATFKATIQEEAMNAIAARRTDVALVLRTGFGKTAIICGPILYEEGLTLWISPLRALLKETRIRLRCCGINVRCAKDGEPKVGEKSVGNVILVSPESVVQDHLVDLAKRMSKRGYLNRIVIDEAHIPYMSRGYRECMGVLRSLADVGGDVQRVLITATAPALLVPAISSVCGVETDGLEVIRGDPCRTNLAIKVVQLEDGTHNRLVRRTVAEVVRFIMRKRKRGEIPFRVLVVCLTINLADEIHSCLEKNSREYIAQCKYHSKMSAREIEAAMRVWENGVKNGAVVMVATDGFCTGTDVPDVRQVVFAGGSRSLVDFWQGAGRGGRDDGATQVIVLYHRAHLIGSMGERDKMFGNRHALGDFEQWAEAKGSCRRKLVEEFLGGLQSFGTCKQSRRNSSIAQIQCDVCDEKEVDSSASAKFHPILPQRRQLTAKQVNDSKRRRENIIHEKEKEMEKMRLVGFALDKICIACFVENMSRVESSDRRLRYNSEIQRAQKCRRSLCGLSKKRCLRCHQEGHRVNSCTVMERTRERGVGVCYKCFLSSVDGRQIHKSSEFGNGVGGCPFAALTRLALTCYSMSSIRVAMQREFPEIIGKSTKEIADWMLKDRDRSNSASLFKVVKWVLRHFQIEEL